MKLVSNFVFHGPREESIPCLGMLKERLKDYDNVEIFSFQNALRDTMMSWVLYFSFHFHAQSLLHLSHVQCILRSNHKNKKVIFLKSGLAGTGS